MKLQHKYLNGDLYAASHDNPESIAQRQYIQKKLKPEEYINLISGKYGHSSSDLSELKDQLKDHPHNNPRNNSLALHAMRNDEEDRDRLIDKLTESYHLPSEDIHEIINAAKTAGEKKEIGTKLKNQPGLTKEHLMRIAQDPKMALGEATRHPAMDKEIVDAALHKPNTFGPGSIEHLLSTVKHNDPSKRLIDQDGIEKLVRHGNWHQNSNSLDSLLSHLEPEKDLFGNEDHSKKKNIIDDLLGINGGDYRNDVEYHEDPSDHGWDNWVNGNQHHPEKAIQIAGSKHLSPSQIEHIKRHGDLDEKYALFHNPHIDPKHAEEMYNKWINDDVDHGYNLDDFKDKIKSEHPYEDMNDDYYDQAQEEAQQNYPFSRYISENVPDEDLMGDTEDNWIENHLDQQDWSHGGEDHSNDMESHPDYQERRNDAQDAYNAALRRARTNLDDAPGIDDRARDRLYDHYDDYIRDDAYDAAERLYDDDMENAHENPNFLPKHLPAIAEINKRKREKEEQEAQKKAKEESLKHKDFLDQSIPNRSESHHYGDLQHHIELAKDYADANGGSIDIGHLNKMHPNMKDKWKQIFENKGKLSSQDLQQKWNDTPKVPYAISHRKWDSELQNINERPQVVFRLDHTPESMKPLKDDPKVHEVFNKIADVSQRSGHPTNANTIAWSRVDTTDPKHWMIDEVQSDFGSAARDYLSENGKPEDAEAVDKIIKYHKNWREAMINHVISEAKKHGVEKVSTHSPESKSAHTGSDKVHSVYKDSYQKVPRSMGFASASYESLPLNEEGKKAFTSNRKGGDASERIRDHLDAAEYHSQLAEAHNYLNQPEDFTILGHGKYTPDHEELGLHNQHANLHSRMAKEHMSAIGQMDPTHWAAKSPTPANFLKQYHQVKESQGDEIDPKKFSDSGTMMAYQDVKSRKSGDLVGIPVHGGDAALKLAPPTAAHPGHTYNLNPEGFKKSLVESIDLIKAELIKAAMDQSTRMKIAMTLKTVQENQPVWKQLEQSNPQAYQAITQLIQSLVDIFKKKTGEDPQQAIHELEIQQHLEEQGSDQHNPGQEPQESEASVPSKSDPIHRQKMVYAPGSIRRYSAQNEKIKDQDGNWNSFGGGLQAPEEGQDGQ